MFRLHSSLFLLAFFLVVALATTRTATAAEVEMEMEMDEASTSTSNSNSNNNKKTGSSSKKKTGLFQRLSRVLDTGAAYDDDGTPIDWEASKDEGEEVDPSKMLNPLTAAELVDAWAKDENLSLIQRALDGDVMFGMKAMLSGSDDLQEAWAAPKVFRFLMKEMPLFKAIKPVAAVVEGKNEEDYTEEDGRAAATAFRKFMFKTTDILEKLKSPEGFMKKIQDYANSKDEEVLRLFEAASNGEDENHMNLNNFLMKKELGDLIDLEFLGFNGEEPTFLGAFRDKVKEFRPAFYDTILTDPEMVKYIENPFKALQEGKAIMAEYGQGR